jgi:glucose-1-phosphate cytidylyltransferase
MKALILAGGLGSRISEESQLRPKPMIEIGGRPIMWHIMKLYAAAGITDFVVCLGYKGYVVKEYFANYFLHMSDVTIDLSSNAVEVHQNSSEPWRVTLLDTGDSTMTGGRLKRAAHHIDGDFCFTYGDGVSDVDIVSAIEFHRTHGKALTVTAVQPPGRYGSLLIADDGIARFEEKPQGDGGWVNGGFFVANPSVIDRIDGDETIFEREPMERLAAEDQLVAFRHEGFWHPMDTLRDKTHLEDLWNSGHAPWKVWS